MTTPPFAGYNKLPIKTFRVPLVGDTNRTGETVDADWLTRELGKIEGTLAPWAQFGRNFVTPLMFGGRPGGPDASDAINRAIRTGYPVDFLGLTWYANNLGQTASEQCLYSSTGLAHIIQNGSGDLLTLEGDDVQCWKVVLEGDAPTPTYTGNLFVATGDGPQFWSCGGRYAPSRALYATGQRVQVYGSGDVWATAGTTSADFSIELRGGLGGTDASLYHQLIGIIETLPSGRGGLLLTDTGSSHICGGQIGKLHLATDAAPAGANAGDIVGVRITGPVNVDISNGKFTACALADDLTFGTGTTNVAFDLTNSCAGTITNNGNANNVIVKQVSAGATQKWQVGDDASLAYLEFDPGSGIVSMQQGQVPNNNAWRVMRAAPNATSRAGFLTATASDIVQLGADVAGIRITVPSGQVIESIVNSVVETVLSASGLHIGASTSAPFLSSGTGTPEGAVTAPVGSLFLRTDGGAGTSLYVKESGSGNTGWVGK